MAKTNWQDPRSTEIRSTHISGLQEAVGKVEESIGINTLTESNIPLPEVYISNEDRYRIYQAPEGKRNWLSSPPPIIKKNGVVITNDFEIDFGGGAVIFTTPISEADVLTADISYTTEIVGKQLSSEDYSSAEKEKLAGIETGANKYIHPENHPASMISLNDASNVEDSIAGIKENIASHQSDYTMQIPWGGITTNIGNAYSLSNPAIESLVSGMALSFKCNADATGAVTLNWSGTGNKSVLKANGSPVTNWKNGGVYTVRYDGTNFQLQGEGGDYGNATADKVIAPYTIGTEDGIVTGTAREVVIRPSESSTDIGIANNIFFNASIYDGVTQFMPSWTFSISPTNRVWTSPTFKCRATVFFSSLSFRATRTGTQIYQDSFKAELLDPITENVLILWSSISFAYGETNKLINGGGYRSDVLLQKRDYKLRVTHSGSSTLGTITSFGIGSSNNTRFMIVADESLFVNVY